MKTESEILEIEMARFSEPPRGRRPWHVGHCYDAVTQETLTALLLEYGRQVIIKQGSQKAMRESDCRIVSVKQSNVCGEKAATLFRFCQRNIHHTQR